MDNWYGFTVNAGGEIEGGPEGWTGSLGPGSTYIVTHNSGVRLVPTLTPIANAGQGGAYASTLVDVTENSFSWRNSKQFYGRRTCPTAVSVIVPPEYFGGGA